jgi:hypothetical protein
MKRANIGTVNMNAASFRPSGRSRRSSPIHVDVIQRDV